MTDREWEKEVLNCINGYTKESKVTDINEPLINTGLSSVEIMEIICQLEDKFSLVFTDGDFSNIRTGNDIVLCLKRLSGKEITNPQTNIT